MTGHEKGTGRGHPDGRLERIGPDERPADLPDRRESQPQEDHEEDVHMFNLVYKGCVLNNEGKVLEI